MRKLWLSLLFFVLAFIVFIPRIGGQGTAVGNQGNVQLKLNGSLYGDDNFTYAPAKDGSTPTATITGALTTTGLLTTGTLRTGAITGTEAINITSSVLQGITLQPTTNTNAEIMAVTNAGGTLKMGLDNSAGNGLIAGSSPYAGVFYTTGSQNFVFGVAGTAGLTLSSTGLAIVGSNTAASYSTATNCAVNSASPAACGSAASGAVVVPTATTTYTVNTTAVTAASRIFLFPTSDASNLPSTPTCVAPLLTTEFVESARTAGTSFTFTLASTTGTTCFNYLIIN